ncbi:hypothetical protein LZ31DRAFT_28410 [Colletotrichum somersetense]|nr:hypothetical protein LZ31DRAFT_28410 [Colletotrichum somersetense]
MKVLLPGRGDVARRISDEQVRSVEFRKTETRELKRAKMLMYFHDAKRSSEHRDKSRHAGFVEASSAKSMFGSATMRAGSHLGSCGVCIRIRIVRMRGRELFLQLVFSGIAEPGRKKLQCDGRIAELSGPVGIGGSHNGVVAEGGAPPRGVAHFINKYILTS